MTDGLRIQIHGGALCRGPLPFFNRVFLINNRFHCHQDEFDVTCGDVFVITAKFKGWWVVYRDPGAAASDTERNASQSGWIPAGGWLLQLLYPRVSYRLRS